jgi:hypothetical protein
VFTICEALASLYEKYAAHVQLEIGKEETASKALALQQGATEVIRAQ